MEQTNLNQEADNDLGKPLQLISIDNSNDRSK